MPDEIANQLAQTATQAAPIGGGGLMGLIAAYVVTHLRGITQADLKLVKAEVLAEMAEKYASKDSLADMREDISHIRLRIDAWMDAKK